MERWGVGWKGATVVAEGVNPLRPPPKLTAEVEVRKRLVVEGCAVGTDWGELKARLPLKREGPFNSFIGSSSLKMHCALVLKLFSGRYSTEL